ncbi:RNA pseudouridine synthase [Planctomycetales bacterium 10988]|nr:RNA pseudouridine synthase [Planctomycetales bacterium 10988]
MALPKVYPIYTEDSFGVFWKPPGVLTHSNPQVDSLEKRIQKNLQRMRRSRETPYIGIVHRLDRPVSGAILFGMQPRTTRRLAEQFEARTVKKLYWACTAGVVEPESGEWVDVLRKRPDEAFVEVVKQDHPEGKEARLRYRTIGQTPWGSCLEIELLTGRMHQIRVQAASRGWPLLGDVQYGSKVEFGPQYADARQRGIALHSRFLGFEHPFSGAPIRSTAWLPDSWECLELPFYQQERANPRSQK